MSVRHTVWSDFLTGSRLPQFFSNYQTNLVPESDTGRAYLFNNFRAIPL
jgi:hypothetical protein